MGKTSKMSADDLVVYRRTQGQLLNFRLAGELPQTVRLLPVRRQHVIAEVVNEDTDQIETICINTQGLSATYVGAELCRLLKRGRTNAAEREISLAVTQAAENLRLFSLAVEASEAA